MLGLGQDIWSIYLSHVCCPFAISVRGGETRLHKFPRGVIRKKIKNLNEAKDRNNFKEISNVEGKVNGEWAEGGRWLYADHSVRKLYGTS